MNTVLRHILLVAGMAGLGLMALAQQPAPPPQDEEPATPPPPAETVPAEPAPPPAEVVPADTNAPPVEPRPEESVRNEGPPPGAEPEPAAPRPPEPTDARPGSRPAPSGPTGRPTSGPPAETKENNLPAPPATPVGDGEPGLRLNFRGVPLDLVLNYLSDAAGFIINLETEVRGKVDVWSNHPLTKDEAVELLNTVLNRNGYAAIRNGRTLTIVSRDDAKKRDIPVISGNNPQQIPRNDEIVTQIIPVRYINATLLVKDLQALLPTTATLTANEGGNALVLTDSQANIRRMAEIVKALDTAISSVSAIRVFTLQYADAKALSTVIKDLFQTQDSTQWNNQGGPMQQMFRGFRGGPGGDQGGGGGGGSTGSGRVSTPRVVAVADERSNSVVVSAPEEQMPIIEDLVTQIDKSVEDITELRVFRLRYADPQETADLLGNLFADSSTQTSGQRSQVRFGGAFGGRGGGPFGMAFGGRGGSTATEESARLQKQTRVVAVPDLRTGSVVVSAARDLMDQIARMLEQLDADPAKKKKVFVYSVENTDPQAVQEVIESLFPEQNNNNMRNTRRTQNQNTGQLNNRTSQTRNQGTRNNTGFGGNSGFGANNFNNTGR